MIVLPIILNLGGHKKIRPKGHTKIGRNDPGRNKPGPKRLGAETTRGRNDSGPKQPVKIKGADRIANSVDPDQNALLLRTSLIWVCTVCLGLSVPILRIITVRGNVMAFSLLIGFLVLWFNHLMS